MDSTPEPTDGNRNPEVIHEAEQAWAEASDKLDQVLAYAESVKPSVYANVGGNTDPSVFFDWWKAYIRMSEEQVQHLAAQFGGDASGAHGMTILVAAAALTRLMHSDESMRANTVLAQLEKEMGNNDDDH